MGFKRSVSNVISNTAVIESLLMKPSELPGARSLYRLTNRALAQIRELWQYAGEDVSFLRTLSSRLKLRP